MLEKPGQALQSSGQGITARDRCGENDGWGGVQVKVATRVGGSAAMEQGCGRRQLGNGTGQQNLSIRVHGKRKSCRVGGWVLDTLFRATMVYLLQGQECCHSTTNSIRHVLHLYSMKLKREKQPFLLGSKSHVLSTDIYRYT